MLSISLEDLVVLVVVWFATSMVANLLWTRFVVMKYFGRALIRWIDGLSEDKEGQESISKLASYFFYWAGNAEMKTGRKIKTPADEDGVVKEVDEVLTPIEMMARVIGNYAIMKVKGQNGGTKAQLGRMLQEEAAEGGFPLSPTAMAGIAKGRLGPALAELAVKYGPDILKKKQGDTSSGGEIKGW